MPEPTFGGPWTEEKLSRLKKYLEAYTLIFTRNLGAMHLRRVYVDAFAGTGIRIPSSEDSDQMTQPLFDDDDDAQEIKGERAGRARDQTTVSPIRVY